MNLENQVFNFKNIEIPQLDHNDPGQIRQEMVNVYQITGNKNYAFALNTTNQNDKHYFTRDPDVNDDAFIRACGWAYEPK